ncbi:PREDICTED: uncharacterized protein LOC105560658 [Vollenhovia emeryi]|uniref:uncharacterized protein LOC105560658 n=1 Tax=Vollenhovia emeryi TaxID=411798 RepID=UPI0005F45182|nr:PREDICTED: uncharacterized protein LOC105560658 [Vollenhovia emeryi]
MVLGTLRHISGLDRDALPDLLVDGTEISWTDSVEYLGVTITGTLNWERHVSRTVSRVNTTLHQLKLCRHLLPDTLRVRLIQTLITPIFDYCCVVLTNITREQNCRLQRAFNRCMRFIFHVGWDEHITPYFERLGWLKVETRRQYHVGCFTFSVINKKKPKSIFNNFEFRSDRTCRGTRTPGEKLILPQCRTEFYKRSFCSFAAELWNGLPTQLREVGEIKEFRCRLLEHLRYAGTAR